MPSSPNQSITREPGLADQAENRISQIYQQQVVNSKREHAPLNTHKHLKHVMLKLK